jgi:hypothetical protein
VYLGKVLVRFSEHIRWLGAYFALRPPAPGSPLSVCALNGEPTGRITLG